MPKRNNWKSEFSMKRRLFVHSAILIFAITAAAFSDNFNICAQGGDAKLTPLPKPTPAPKTETKSSRPAAPVSNVLAFGQEMKGRIDNRRSDKGAGGSLYEEYVLNAKSEDLLTFQLQSSDPSVGLQVLDQNNTEIPLTKYSDNGDYSLKTQTGGLPADGEYRVRVVGEARAKTVPFSMKVNRMGLVVNVYNERLTQIYNNFKENDPASLDETVAKLEELTKDDSFKAGAFEFLGILYLYNKRDFEKAEAAMERAIRLNGAAVVKITFDAQWRRMARQKSGQFGWEETRSGWVRIRPGQLTLTDLGNRTLASVSGAQVKELSKVLTADRNLVTITGENARRQFVFEPGSGEQAEADLVIKLIQNHVMGKNN